MKKIICYGDSNTFGFNPKSGNRYNSNIRWTGILAKILSDEFEVIEEGLNNRTGLVANPDGLLQSGQEYLPVLLEKHKSFDIFILALGTNDLQKFFHIDEDIVKNGLINLISKIREAAPDAKIIVIPPLLLNKKVLGGYFCCQFDEKSINKSFWIQQIYQEVCNEEYCELLDINYVVTPSDTDGLHFDEEAHKMIANRLAKHISAKVISSENQI